MSRPAIPAEVKRAVLVEAGHRCAIPTCRFPTTEIAHIVPWEKVRKHEFENLIALCPNCHTRHHKGEIDRQSLIQYKRNLADGRYYSEVPSTAPSPSAADAGPLAVTETRRVPVTREELQRSITVDQQAVLTAIWDHFQKENEWVPHVQLHRRFIGGGIGTAGVQAAVDALPEGIVWSNNWEGGIHRYALSFAGVLLADQGKEVEPLMVRHLEYVKCRYLAEEDGKIKSRDVAAALDLSPGEVHFLGRIVHLSTFRGTSSSLGSEEWDTDPPHDVDELAEAEDVRSFLWNRALWNVAWVEEIPVWEGVEWGDGFIAVFGPLDSLADRDAEEHDPRAVEALKEAGYEVRFARQDKVSQHRSQDYRFVYATDRRTWKRKLAQGKEQYLMARRREL